MWLATPVVQENAAVAYCALMVSINRDHWTNAAGTVYWHLYSGYAHWLLTGQHTVCQDGNSKLHNRTTSKSTAYNITQQIYMQLPFIWLGESILIFHWLKNLIFCLHGEKNNNALLYLCALSFLVNVISEQLPLPCTSFCLECKWTQCRPLGAIVIVEPKFF